MKASVIGGGSWGSAFALYLGRQKIKTKLWIREPDIFETAWKEGENKVFLPGFFFPPEVTFHHDLQEALAATDLIFVAVPSEFCRKTYSDMAPFLSRDQVVISLTKGIEKKTLMRMSEVMTDVFKPFFPVPASPGKSPRGIPPHSSSLRPSPTWPGRSSILSRAFRSGFIQAAILSVWNWPAL